MSTKPRTLSTPVAFGDEADSHVRVISADRQNAMAEWTRCLRFPAVSGLECVQALRSAGFQVAARPPGCVEMRREGLVVQVPLSDRLEPGVLVAVLIRAGVGPVRFYDLLDANPRSVDPVR